MFYVVVALAFVALWLNGNRVRGTWSDKTIVRPPLAYTGGGTATVGIFMLTGAFNGPAHLERQAQELRQEGDVYVTVYPTRLFSAIKAVKAVFAAITGTSYDRIVLIGYSLGGLLALRVLELAFILNPALSSRIELIIGDAPLGPQHLLIPGGARVPKAVMPFWLRIAPLLRFVHPGPILNLLSPLVAKVFFVEMEESKREPGTDMDQFRRHMAFLRANLVSLIVAQIAAMASQKPFQARPRSNRVTYLQCDHDVVVAGDEARADWKKLFPDMTVIKVGPGTQHVAIVEAHEAFAKAVRSHFAQAA